MENALCSLSQVLQHLSLEICWVVSSVARVVRVARVARVACQGHHHHHNQNNMREAAQDFRMARQDYNDAQRDFSQGNIRGALSELGEARQHEADGLSHLSGGRGWI